MSHRKRRADDDLRPECSSRSSSAATAATEAERRRPSFPSHLDVPDLPPKTRVLCEIVAVTPAASVEAALDDAALHVTPSDVEEVLKLSYAHPAAAVRFFRWAGARLGDAHSPYAWNLVVDLLGKNRLFDAAWDAVRSMRTERLISLATFASLFSSLVAASRPDDALHAFLALEDHGVRRDAPALNSLLSAACREGRAALARSFLARAARAVLPDADSFAILLEACENEADVRAAREVFAEMVACVGWDPANVPAYNSFLVTLVRASGADALPEALRFLSRMRENGCYPGMKFFRAALDECVKRDDARGAQLLWDLLAGRRGCFPDTDMYNSMIALQFYGGEPDIAQRLLDEMVVFGAFPDSQTYDLMLQFLLKSRKIKDSVAVFNEMVRNECFPTESNCSMAMKVFLDHKDWEMGIKVWKCMVENNLPLSEESANMLIGKLRDLDKLPEACKLAEDMIDRGIKLQSSTLAKLRTGLLKVGKGSIYDHLLRKWKAH